MEDDDTEPDEGDTVGALEEANVDGALEVGNVVEVLEEGDALRYSKRGVIKPLSVLFGTR